MTTDSHWAQIPALPSDGSTMFLASPDGVWECQYRYDGCFDIKRFFNGDRDDYDRLHVCDIDDFISKLTSLRAIALEHFGKI